MTPHEMSEKWHKLALTHNMDVLAAALHDDAVFESPVVHTPQCGKAITAKYLASASHVFANSGFHYLGEWYGDHSIILEFKAEIEGVTINGIDMISFDKDGLITHFKVMVRPLQAMNKLHAKMGEMLQKMAG